MIAAHVRQQLNLHAAVLLAAFGGVVIGNGVVLANADQVEAMRGNVVLRCQVLHHSIGAALAQIVVVLGRSGRVGPAGDFKNVALRRASCPAKLSS